MTVLEALQLAMVWYFVLSAVAILTLPVTFHVCSGLSDRGFSIYRATGLLIVTVPIWWLGNLMAVPFSSTMFGITAAALGVVAWLIELKRREILPFVAMRWRRILVLEIATAALFFGYVMLRGYNPDTRGTEKPMEMAFLNAAILTDRLPVPDPWFAGEPINYYYFGYAVLGLLAKVTQIPGGIVFHLGLATTFSLAAIAVAGLTANLTDRLSQGGVWPAPVAGTLGAFFLMFAGNMHAAVEFIRHPRRTLDAGWWDGVGWASSRVIEDGGFPDDATRTVISEFPAFSWILGDLHPHVLAYPWLIAAISLVFNLFVNFREHHRPSYVISSSIAIGVMLGVLYSANTWDVPVIAFLTLVALLLAVSSTGIARVVVAGAGAAVAAVLVALPFAMNYTPAAGDPHRDAGIVSNVPLVGPLMSTVGYVDWDRTSTGELLLVHGGFLVLTGLVIVALWFSSESRRRHTLLTFAALAVGSLIVALMSGTPALFLIGLPLGVVLWLLVRHHANVSSTFALTLLASALAAIIATEFFFVRDPFGDRMNTVFKIYFQVWALFSIALAALVPVMIDRLRSTGRGTSAAMITVPVIVLLLSMSVYAPLSSYRWFNEFDKWHGIDGLAYLEEFQPEEAAAIEWFSDVAGPATVLLEAPGCSYGSDHGIPHNRFSMATGIPTIVGWEGHQYQWRRQQPDLSAEVPRRIEHVSTIYEIPTDQTAAEYLDEYGVTHIVVGIHETRGYARCEVGPPYDPDGLGNLDALGWEIVYSEGGVTILALPEAVGAN
jgi:YYY domain-containing protein